MNVCISGYIKPVYIDYFLFATIRPVFYNIKDEVSQGRTCFSKFWAWTSILTPGNMYTYNRMRNKT